MKEMTKQQIFNKVAMHLAKQGKKCWPDDKRAFAGYLQKADGTACAVGCLLPKKAFVGVAWAGNIESVLRSRGVEYETHAVLLNNLMDIHDGSKVSRWGQKLRALAKREGLKVPEWLRMVK